MSKEKHIGKRLTQGRDTHRIQTTEKLTVAAMLGFSLFFGFLVIYNVIINGI